MNVQDSKAVGVAPTDEKRSASLAFGLAAAELAYNTRCENVVLLDLRGRSPVTEFFVLATGTSPRQMRTVVEEVRDLGKKMGSGAWQTSGLESGRWILVDCVTVVCHVFDEEARDFYDLELLWGDCPRIDWRKELGLPPVAVGEREAGVKVHFREGSHLDEIDAEEEEERELSETEGEDDMDEDADGAPAVVVELPDESTGSNSVEFVEIDAPRTRGKREHALYPTTIEDEEAMEGENAMHVVNLADGVPELDEDDERPARQMKVVVKKEKASKKSVKKAAKAPAKKPVKAPAKKAIKKKPAKAAAKKAALKSPARKTVKKKPVTVKKKVAKAAVKKRKK